MGLFSSIGGIHAAPIPGAMHRTMHGGPSLLTHPGIAQQHSIPGMISHSFGRQAENISPANLARMGGEKDSLYSVLRLLPGLR